MKNNDKQKTLKKLTIKDLEAATGGMDWRDVVKKVAYPAEFVGL